MEGFQASPGSLIGCILISRCDAGMVRAAEGIYTDCGPALAEGCAYLQSPQMPAASAAAHRPPLAESGTVTGFATLPRMVRSRTCLDTANLKDRPEFPASNSRMT